MKVPHSVVGRTRPSGEGLGYLQPADMTGFGRGLSEGLAALGSLGKQWEQRQEQFQRFQGLTDLTEFETLIGEQLTAMKRDAAVNIANFPMQAEVAFDKQRAEFMNKRVPAELQPEFEYRTGLIKQRVVGDALTFQYQSQDKFFATEMVKRFDESRLRLSKATDTKAALAEEQKFLADHLSHTALPEGEKVRLAREYDIGLQAVVYQREYVQSKLENPASSAHTYEQAAGLLKKEEGFRATPYWDVNAYRVGYGSDTVTKADGSVVKVTKSMTITKEDADRDLSRRMLEFEKGAIGKVGADAWGNLSSGARAALVSVAYNYGSLPSSVVNAIKSGNVETIAQAVEGLSANKKRRMREAAIIRGGSVPVSDIDNDPRFAKLPYDTRIALQADGDLAVKQMLEEQARQQKEAYDAQLNTLKNGLLDRTLGMQDINEAYQGGKGWLNKYEDRQAAINIFNQKDSEAQTLLEGQQKLARGPYEIWSDSDQKYQNALFKQNGQAALQAGDPNYASALAAMAAQTRDVPTDAISMLQAMTRSNDSARMLYAYNTLGMLQDRAPDAFAKRAGEGLTRDLEYWRLRKDSLPEDQLVAGLRGGVTQEERQQRLVLRKEAQDYLATKERGIPTLNQLADDFVSDYGSLLGTDPSISNVPWAARGLYRDFQVAFVDAYERVGTVEEATELAKGTLKRQYSVTAIGGVPTLMKRPPEKAGYNTVGGKFDWIDAQAREMLELDDEQFQLISDDQTEQEFDKWQRNELVDENGKPRKPSYRVVVNGEFGWAAPMAENNKPKRMWFEPSAEQLKGDEIDFETQSLEQELRDARVRYDRERQNPASGKTEEELTQEYLDNEQRIMQKLGTLADEDPRPEPYLLQSPEDIMLQSPSNPIAPEKKKSVSKAHDPGAANVGKGANPNPARMHERFK